MRKRGRAITLVFGTRPEIIKLSPVIRALKQRRVPHFLVHTGQHYSYAMDRIFFKELGLEEPTYQLSEKSKSAALQADHTGRMMEAIEGVLLKEMPSFVVVQGDTNTVLAGSLAAAKIPQIRLAHVEAGLRSHDRRMPEEINRIVSDHVSDVLFAPTPAARLTLLREGVSKEKIHVTGNTIVDAVKQNIRLAEKSVSLSRWLGRSSEEFFLMTLHRQENVDDRERLSSILAGIEKVIQHFGIKVIFPAHPRTVDRLKQFRLRLPEKIERIPPVGFLEFLRLEQEAGLLLSDSGGVQEEACILDVPCVTLRTTTERPETVHVGANLVAGFDPDRILACAKKMFGKKRGWVNPFGDGRAAERIVSLITR